MHTKMSLNVRHRVVSPAGIAERTASHFSFHWRTKPRHLCLLFIHPPAHGSEVSPAARNTLDSARIPRASKLLICGLFQKGRVLAQDGMPRSRAETWVQARATLGPEHASPLRRGSPGLDSRSSRDESANKRRNHAGMVPADRRLVKFGARG